MSDPRGVDEPGAPGVDDAVPQLPRGRGIRLSRPQLFRIGGTLLLLAFVIVAQRPCADSVSKFVTGFGDQGSASTAMPRPGTIDLPAGSGSGSADEKYEHLRPGMTDDEVKAAIERARERSRSAQ